MFSQKSNPEFQIFINFLTNEIGEDKKQIPISIETRLRETDLIGQKFVTFPNWFFVITCGEQLKY